MPENIARVEKRFKSPGPHPNGLQAAPDGLWYIDQVDNKVYRLDYESGETLFEAQTDTQHSSGITLGGGYLWIASTFELKIAKIDPQTGATVAKYDSPGAGITAPREHLDDPKITGDHGLEWRDGKIYIASPPSQMIHVVEADSWREVHRFRVPGLRVHGLAWGEGDRLWSADTSAGTVSLLDTDEGRIYDIFRVEAPDEVHGMTIHEGVLWYCHAETRDIGCLIRD
jgi:streptogramin lyase